MNYIAKVKEKFQDPDTGKDKKKTAIYLVEDAVCVTDVEVIVTKKYKGLNIDWELISVTESKIEQVLTAEDIADRFNA